MTSTRTNNTPEHDRFEPAMLQSGRHRARPRQGLVGAHTERLAPARQAAPEDPRTADQAELVERGSDVAPTQRAERRECERHRIEQTMGHFAAGHSERLRAENTGPVTRADLDRAARTADEDVRPRRR